MLDLWELAGEIGAKAENDPRYAAVYDKLSDALDIAEYVKLIEYKEDTE